MTDTPERTPITDYQLKALTANLNMGRTSQRKQGSSTLTYMEAWDIKAALIRIFGYGGFSAEVTDSKIERILTQAEAGGNAKWIVLATATVRLTIHQTGAVYTEAAASSQSGSQIGEVADFAIKTAESDALKRCAIYLGTQFGLSLYNNGSPQDVVKKVFAPDQVWPLSDRTQFEAAQTSEVVAGIIDNRQLQAGPPEGSSLSAEQYAATQELLNRGLRMKAEQEQDPVEFAAAAAEAAKAPGVPAALDPSLEPGFEEQHADSTP